MKVYGKIVEGKPKIQNAVKLREFFYELKEGEEFQVTLTSSKDIRNLEMNNLYWAWLSELSLHSGYTKRELHNYFKEQLLDCHESQINGRHILDCQSTSDLTIKQFSHYLDEVARLASEHFNFVLKSL